MLGQTDLVRNQLAGFLAHPGNGMTEARQSH
jgi:hypothetical protein